MKIAIKIINSKVIEFKNISDSDSLPEGFDEIWTNEQWLIYVSDESNTDLSIEQIYSKDIKFSKLLLDEFLLDSRDDPNVTTSISLQLLQKFGEVGSLLQFYDVKGAYLVIPSIEVDAFFTQERKDKYISMIEQHILYL